MTDWTKLVSGEQLIIAAKRRSSPVDRKTKIDISVLPTELERGWNIVKTYKNGKYTIEKNKRNSDIFENEVWMLFYKMGFTIMNFDNSFVIEFGDGATSKQIDVVAMDDETCIFVECKAADELDRNCSFKQDLEAINGYYPEACRYIKERFGDKKFKFIFATKNYLITDDSKDMNRINYYGFSYMNQDTVDYYNALAKHLGTAARFQLLGNLFKNERIVGLDVTVPAIKGTMGGFSYYSFLIEPEKLLKISYILHRNKANHLLMPTYQRLIKKERLNAIKNFVNEGGFFPNSLIVSINSFDNELFFSPSTNDVSSSLSQLGLLTLPARYRSVYIIDGQHRLYGYSDATSVIGCNVIPVVAFVNLPPNKQVQIFMDINENQKKVSKTLRNTLNIDLLWNDASPKKRNNALMLKIAEALGDSPASPLYGRILTGEDKETNIRCITTEYIKEALSQSSFLNTYSNRGVIEKHGTFDKGNNDDTFPVLLQFLQKCLGVISEFCSNEWRLGRDGFLTINNTIYALIKIIDDIINIKLSNTEYHIGDVDMFYSRCEGMLLDLCEAINGLNDDAKTKIRKAKGGGAKKEAWRTLQVALNSINQSFTSADLQQYIEDNCTDNNPEAAFYLQSIEAHIISQFKMVLTLDPDWSNKKLSAAHQEGLASKLATENARRSRVGQEQIDIWSIITFEDISQICVYSSNWSSFAQNILSPVSNGTRNSTITWLKNLFNCQKKIKTGRAITRNEFGEIKRIYNIFCKSDDSNN